jgi:hypothetical protein
MKRLGITIALTAALAVFGVPPAESGQRGSQGSGDQGRAGSGNAGGGSRTGGGSSGGGSSSSSSGGGGGGAAVARPSGGSSSASGSAGSRSAPERGVGRAVPRYGDAPSSSGGRTRVSGGTTSRSASGGGRVSSDGDRSDRVQAVPSYSRPREGRVPLGSAISRADAPPRTDISVFLRYVPIGFGGYYGGFGYNPYFYDPFWGYYGYSPGYYGYGGYGYGGGGYYSSQAGYRDTGSLRLKVKPREAQVFVDGYYMGTVDQFDGVFQRLRLESGGHRIELRGEGLEPLVFEVLIVPGETITYRGELKRVQ